MRNSSRCSCLTAAASELNWLRSWGYSTLGTSQERPPSGWEGAAVQWQVQMLGRADVGGNTGELQRRG